MAKQFLDSAGLATFFTQLKELFATTAEVAAIEADTNTYVLNIDYEKLLAFDTTEIVIGKTPGDEDAGTSAILGKAILGQMVLG